MAKFHLTDPSGAEYEVDAPDEQAAVAALKQVSAKQQPSADYSKMSDADLMRVVKPPIHIGAPDGSIVEFPAGTSDDTINAAMRKAYPPSKGTTLNIEGRKVNVDNSFLHLSPDQQNSTVDEIAKSLRSAPGDEPKSTLQTVREAIHAPTRLLENGVFLGLGDRARAGMGAIVGDGSYGDNLKKEQGETEDFQKAHPIASPIIEGVGGAIAPAGAVAAASKGAGIGAKILYGTGAGGTIGGVRGALGSKDWTDVKQTGKDAGTDAVISGVIGGAIPVAGKAIGAGYNAVANAVRGNTTGMSRGAAQHLVSAMEADGPAAVQARVKELGPDAMLVDAGPAFLGKGQGASLNSDEGRSVLQSALTRRNEGTNARIQSDVDKALGPAQGEDPQLVTDRIRRFREEQDAKAYPAALENAPPVKIAPVMTDLIDRISETPVGSMEHKALTNLQAMLTKTKKEQMLDAGGYPVYDKFGNERFKDVPYSHDDANVLHKVKGELDNVIQYDAPGLGVPAGALSRQQASLKQMRFQINDALENQVPGYAAANRVSAALAKRIEAVELGTQYLGAERRLLRLVVSTWRSIGLSRARKSPSPRARAAISSGCSAPRLTTFRRSAANCRAKAVGIPPRLPRCTDRTPRTIWSTASIVI